MNINVLKLATKKPFVGEEFSNAFREHKNYIFLCSYFFLLTYIFLSFTIGYSDTRYFTEVFSFFLRSTTVFGIATVSIYLLVLLISKRPKESPIRFSYDALRNNLFQKENCWRIFFGIAGLSLTTSAFLVLKVSIPMIQPFSYDTHFETLDRIVHFGYQPWELLQPLLGHEYVTLFLHRLYYLWFPVIFITFFWQVGTRHNNQLRLQFIMSYVACWALIGGVLATLLSSAGPIYFDQIVLDTANPYLNANQYLLDLDKKHQLYMFQIRDLLWHNYINPGQGQDIKGISAMPSMHVSIAFLLVLFGWKKGFYWGSAYTLFFVAIALGSVHLMWHYAIDGYVSIFATWIIWAVCGKLTKPLNSK